MAHAQKPDSIFLRSGRVRLNQQGRQFSRLLAAEVCASAVVMLDAPCSEVVSRVLATHSIRQFPLHFPSLRQRVPPHFKWTLRQTPCSVTSVIYVVRLIVYQPQDLLPALRTVNIYCQTYCQQCKGKAVPLRPGVAQRVPGS